MIEVQTRDEACPRRHPCRQGDRRLQGPPPVPDACSHPRVLLSGIRVCKQLYTPKISPSANFKAYLPNWIHMDYGVHCRGSLVSSVLPQFSAAVRINDFFGGEKEKYAFA